MLPFSLPSILSSWVWDPPRDLLIIPGIEHPIRLYGVLFALGFLFAYFYMIRLFTYCLKVESPTLSKETCHAQAGQLADKLCWFVVAGTILGARLGHVFFYQWSYYAQHPLEIFQIWKGGLASHGGIVAILLALTVYVRWILPKRLPNISFIRLLDLVAIPSAFVACCIRIGNFFNQEIVGIPTQMPWGIRFGSPLDGQAGIPLHPAQLYEAISYFAIFILLAALWKRFKLQLPEGSYIGLLFFLTFSCRILIETVKVPQSEYADIMSLSTGQLLSIPFVAAGMALLFRAFLLYRNSTQRRKNAKEEAEAVTSISKH